MDKGQVITGKLVGFTYVGKDTKWCRVTVASGDERFTAIIGEASIYKFGDMLSLKGAGAEVSMTYVEDNDYGAQFNNVEFKLD